MVAQKRSYRNTTTRKTKEKLELFTRERNGNLFDFGSHTLYYFIHKCIYTSIDYNTYTYAYIVSTLVDFGCGTAQNTSYSGNLVYTKLFKGNCQPPTEPLSKSAKSSKKKKRKKKKRTQRERKEKIQLNKEKVDSLP